MNIISDRSRKIIEEETGMTLEEIAKTPISELSSDKIDVTPYPRFESEEEIESRREKLFGRKTKDPLEEERESSIFLIK